VAAVADRVCFQGDRDASVFGQALCTEPHCRTGIGSNRPRGATAASRVTRSRRSAGAQHWCCRSAFSSSVGVVRRKMRCRSGS
jgi:hypothetical protein